MAIDKWHENKIAYDNIIYKIINRTDFNNSIIIRGVNYLVHALANGREDIASNMLYKSEQQVESGEYNKALDLNRSLLFENEGPTNTLLKAIELCESDDIPIRIIEQKDFEINNLLPNNINYLSQAISKNKVNIALRLINDEKIDINLYSRKLIENIKSNNSYFSEEYTTLMELANMLEYNAEILDNLLIKKPKLWLKKKTHTILSDEDSDTEDERGEFTNEVKLKNALDLAIISLNKRFVESFLAYLKETMNNLPNYRSKVEIYSEEEDINLREELERAIDYLCDVKWRKIRNEINSILDM